MKTKSLFIKRLDNDSSEVNRFSFVASTEAPDRYGDIINVQGWQLENYRSNPIILLNHNASALPMGRGDVAIVDNQLMIEVEFDMEDEKAAEVARKVKAGFINAVSVGFNSGASVYRNELPEESKYYGEKGIYFQSAELLEVSIVTIPANPEAIAAKEYKPDTEQLAKEVSAQVAKHILEVLEEEGKYIVTYAKPAPEAVEEEVIEEGYKEEEEDKEEEKYFTKISNFPEKGEDKKISLRNSNHKIFPLDFAQRIKEEYPDIWGKGGNIKGNAQYAILSKIQKENNGAAETPSQEKAIKVREAWAARHKENYLLAGVVAQMKWLVIGSKGIEHMKNVINEEIKKQKEKNFNMALMAELINMTGAK
tara:strand:+ start:396 stop:1490 length:1095 start_codon:yes stop_codon:yes gene_type:complete